MLSLQQHSEDADWAKFELPAPFSRSSLLSKYGASSVATRDLHRTRRRVRFAKRCRVLIIRSVHDMSEGELRDAFYSPEELQVVLDDVADTVRQLRVAPGGGQNKTTGASEEPSPTGICTRGLEHYVSPHGMQLRTERKEKVVDAVLDAQEAGGDANQIAQAAAKTSLISKQLARNNGLSDERYICRERVKQVADRRMNKWHVTAGWGHSRAARVAASKAA